MEYINIVFFEIPEGMWKNGVFGKMLSCGWYAMIAGVFLMYVNLIFKHIN